MIPSWPCGRCWSAQDSTVISPSTRLILDARWGRPHPDFSYEPRSDVYEGLCIYLDGMGRHLHGRTETREKDRDIRDELRNRGYDVVVIQFGQLTDSDAMRQHFFRIGRFLLGKDAASTYSRRFFLAHCTGCKTR